MTNETDREPKVPAGDAPDGNRREALKKMALYSAYATPALLALMHSKKAQALSVSLDN